MIKIIKKMFIATACVACFNPDVAFAQNEEVLSEDLGYENLEESTVIYDLDYIAQQKGMVTVIDLINRIPGGSSFIPFDDGSNAKRGFSNNKDPILINGHRLSGKSNSSRQALSQIPIDQVLRIEIIRGSSPDIKVSSQGALLNVVLRGDVAGSGTWSAWGYLLSGKVGGALNGSYASRKDFLDYSVSLSLDKISNEFPRHDSFYDADNKAIYKRAERPDTVTQKGKISSNATLNLNNGTAINVNGQIDLQKEKIRRPGDFLNPDENGDLTLAGQSMYNYLTKLKNWELGTDYDYPLNDDWQVKFLALHSQANTDEDFGEDFEILNNQIQDDYHVIQNVFSSENIGRVSFVWTPSSVHRLEFGSELSFNQKRTDFNLFTLVDGVLVPENIDASDVTVKEKRDESFLIHSWQINEKLSLDSALTFEYSQIKQNGPIQDTRSFQFLKPSFDARYNLTKEDQFQISLKRSISQLDFADFASSFSNDNEVVGGNKNLAPERSWEYSLAYEHRLDDDKGFIKPSFTFYDFSSKLGRIETAPGISGVGDVGQAQAYSLDIEGALRLKDWGLPNIQISGLFKGRHSQMTDPFTHENVSFNDWVTSPDGWFKIRQDIPEYSFFWAVEISMNATRNYRDLDEITTDHPHIGYWVNISAEKQIFEGVIMSLSYENITNPKYSRHRYFYENGRVGGDLTRFEDRNFQFNRQLYVSIKGTF